MRLTALGTAAAVATPLVVSAASAHARAHSSGPLSQLASFAVPAVLAMAIALIAIARVVSGKAHPLKGAGRYLLGCTIVPLAAWLAYSSGPHTASRDLVFWLGSVLVASLVLSSLIAATATN
jgi:membrane-associated phospholipid phosphatase